MAITSDSTTSSPGQVSGNESDTTDTSGETYASDLPSWETTDLTSLAQEGKLYGIDPYVIGALTQAEERGVGGFINAEHYGGFFGLSDVASYPGGSPSAALLQDTSSPSFEQQAEITASQIAYNEKTTSDLYAAVAKSWGGDASYLPDYGIPNTSNSGLTFPTNVGYGPPVVTGGKTTSPDTTNTGPQSFGAASTLGKILIQLDLILNPQHSIQAPGTLESILTLGAADAAYGISDVAMIVATVIFRGFFVLGFLALLWTGIQDITEKRAGRVAGGIAAPIKGVAGIIGSGTDRYGTPIQRAREERLRGAAAIQAQGVAARSTIAESRAATTRSVETRKTRRQTRQLAELGRKAELEAERQRLAAIRASVAQRSVAVKESREARIGGLLNLRNPELTE
jgi:hypothetical protein